MSTLEQWFELEILRWRSYSAKAWVMIIVLFTTFPFTAITNFSLFNPHLWLYKNFLNLTRAEFLSFTWGLMLTILLIAMLTTRFYRVTCDIPRSLLWNIWSHVSPVRLVFIVSHMLAASVATWCITQLIGDRYDNFYQNCSDDDSDETCVNEVHLFIVVYGTLLGGFFEISFFAAGEYHMRFPVVNQTKFFEVKGRLLPIVWSSACHVFRYVKYFYLCYYLFLGALVKHLMKQSLGVGESKTGAVDTIGGLLDVSLFCYTLIIGTYVHFLLRLPRLLHTVYNTEPILFPVATEMDEYQNKCLHHALASQNNPLLQYLACLDLHRLAKYSASRRQEVFSLTQLGGHCVNWTNISTTCLAQLAKFTSDVSQYNDHRTMCNPLSGDNPTPPVPPAPMAADTPRFPTTPGLIHRTSTPASAPNRIISNSVQSPVLPVPKPIPNMYIELLKRQPAIAYFICESPEAASRRLFVDSQKYIWIVDALSHIVASSYTEDTYGVVQKGLPEILTTFITMLEAIEKHIKLSPILMRRTKAVGTDFMLRFALKAAVKSAIYRIVATFGQHLGSVMLKTEHRRRLQMFEEWKE